MRIKKAKPEDAEKISRLTIETIKKINKKNKEYAKEQFIAWIDDNSPEVLVKKIKNREVFYAEEGKEIVGVIAFDNEKIYNLFVKYNKLGKGIGKKLLKYVEKIVRKRKIKKLSLTATPSVYVFYIKQDFIPIKYVAVNIRGIDFKEPYMEKKIWKQYT